MISKTRAGYELKLAEAFDGYIGLAPVRAAVRREHKARAPRSEFVYLAAPGGARWALVDLEDLVELASGAVLPLGACHHGRVKEVYTLIDGYRHPFTRLAQACADCGEFVEVGK